jgi:thioesterase domain-containing protein
VRRGSVELTAPLDPNINHRDTVFGGSASALAILAAWTAIYLRLGAEGFATRLVIQRHSMSFDKPIEGHFQALCALSDQDAWARFTKTLTRRHKARIRVSSRLSCGGQQVGRLEGEFVAVVTER